MLQLEGKVIVVTGGTSGLGAAIARRASEEGAQVAIVGRNAAAAQSAAAGLPNARGYGADVTSLSAIMAAMTAIVGDFGRIDGAVNNAGIGGQFALVADCSTENWQTVIDVNLTGVFNCLKAQLPEMLSRHGGSIVNMASLSGLLAEPFLSAYVASKHALIGLTKSLALDYARSGIRCNAICPSFVRTPMTEAGIPDEAIWNAITERHPIGRLVTPREVAEATNYLLSDRSSGITGTTHVIDGGIAMN